MRSDLLWSVKCGQGSAASSESDLSLAGPFSTWQPTIFSQLHIRQPDRIGFARRK